MIKPTGQTENFIVNRSFIQQLEKDMKKYDILYLSAPLGWGKSQIKEAFCEKYAGENLIVLEETEDVSLKSLISKIPSARKNIYLIPELEKILEREQEDLIWKLIEQKKKGDVFLFLSALGVPEKLLPYTVLNKYFAYGVDAIRPTNEDVAVYMKNRGIVLSKEELLRIEKDTNNMPLYILMLANLLEASDKGYRSSIKDQCYRDVFTFLDVTFFRTFTRDDQNAIS